MKKNKYLVAIAVIGAFALLISAGIVLTNKGGTSANGTPPAGNGTPPVNNGVVTASATDLVAELMASPEKYPLGTKIQVSGVYHRVESLPMGDEDFFYWRLGPSYRGYYVVAATEILSPEARFFGRLDGGEELLIEGEYGGFSSRLGGVVLKYPLLVSR